MMNTTMSEMSKASEITTTSEKHIQASGCVCAPANCEPKRPRDQECLAVAEAAGSLDKMSGWPEGGIASAGNIVDKMSGCVRARLKWCPRS